MHPLNILSFLHSLSFRCLVFDKWKFAIVKYLHKLSSHNLLRVPAYISHYERDNKYARDWQNCFTESHHFAGSLLLVNINSSLL